MRLRWRKKGAESLGADSSPKTRKPNDTPFLQQRLKSWRPVMTQKSAIASFSLIGILFLPIGIALFIMSTKVREVRIDYTRCGDISQIDRYETLPSENIEMRMRSQSATSLGAHWMRSDKEVTFDGLTKNYTQCTIDFHLPEALEAPVLIYYRLTNFMQNHRKYAHSRSGDQLKGVAASLSSVRSSCNVVATEVEPVTGREMAVYPCGAIANSIFNDTFESPQLLPDATGPGSNSRQVSYTMSNKGIAPLLDMALYAPSSYSVADEPGDNGTIIVPPPNWAERYPRGYHSGNMFDPAGDEAFMVWMHNSASPDFTKLAMRNDQDSMPEGFYRLNIMSHFPIRANDGRKYIVITNPATFSRRKPLGVAYIIVGGLSILFATATALSLFHKERPLWEHRYLHVY